jgi:rhamnosyl/mannosyltransferase
MKVLQVGKFYPPYVGGMETVLKNLCEALKSKVDIEVLVANTFFKTLHENSSFPITRVASIGTFLSCSIAPSFLYWLRNLSGDILHIHIPNPLAELSYLFSRKKGRMVGHFHSDIVRQKSLLPIYGPFLRLFYERADRIIVPSPNHISVSSFLPRFRKKCRVIPYGISLGEFELNKSEMETVKKLMEKGCPKLLFVGRLVYYKGLDVLIRAMREVKAKLWIIGTGPLEQNLRELIAKLGLVEKIEFLGSVDQRGLVCYYHACDIFVLPSVARSEMFGMVQLEAMACRKPVISTNLPTGVSWVNQHGITGLSLPLGDSSALAKAIQELIDNPHMCEQMGEAGRKRVEETFTIEKMAAAVFEVYREVLSG